MVYGFEASTFLQSGIFCLLFFLDKTLKVLGCPLYEKKMKHLLRMLWKSKNILAMWNCHMNVILEDSTTETVENMIMKT